MPKKRCRFSPDEIVCTAKLTYRELSTILAALRIFQEEEAPILDGDEQVDGNSDHFIDVDPLTVGQIDELCERLNCGDA